MWNVSSRSLSLSLVLLFELLSQCYYSVKANGKWTELKWNERAKWKKYERAQFKMNTILISTPNAQTTFQITNSNRCPCHKYIHFHFPHFGSTMSKFMQLSSCDRFFFSRRRCCCLSISINKRVCGRITHIKKLEKKNFRILRMNYNVELTGSMQLCL